jgi:hypothetical protein
MMRCVSILAGMVARLDVDTAHHVNVGTVLPLNQ